MSAESEILNRESAVIGRPRLSLERGRTDPLFRSSLKSSRSAAAIASVPIDNGRVQALSGNHSNGTGVIEDGIDLTRRPELNKSIALTEICPTCGGPLTRGECLRCLVSLGFLSDSQQPDKVENGRRLTPGPLKYDHFQVEVGD